jgi:hypothetical protein
MAVMSSGDLFGIGSKVVLLYCHLVIMKSTSAASHPASLQHEIFTSMIVELEGNQHITKMIVELEGN